MTRLIDAEAAHAVREAFGEMHGWSRHQLMEWQPPDFEIALWDGDLAYRRKIHDLIEAATADAIEELFISQRAVGRSIMVKWPSAQDEDSWDGVPNAFHNDAAYVDERDGSRTYGVWLALQDMSEANGCVQAVPHSHRLKRTIRGWDVEAPWLAHAEVYRRRSVSLPLRAGEAFVWDPALIHRSGPNRTDQPRVAATLLVTEPGADLAIFRRRDEQTAEKVELSATFFLDGRYEEIEALAGSEIVHLDLGHQSAKRIDRQLARYAAADRVDQVLQSAGRRIR